MLGGSRSRTRDAITVAIGCLAVVLSFSATTLARADDVNVTLLGPVLTRDESLTVNMTRDAGMGVALPNGNDLWIFGDTARYQYIKGAWTLNAFVSGSTAAEGRYAQGRLPDATSEVMLGHNLAVGNHIAQFIPPAGDIYMPDGTGRLCTWANGSAEQGVRWPIGAALMPDGVNVLVTYLEPCVLSAISFTVEGWGFMEYNWTTNTISVPPVDVFPPATSGAALPGREWFGSPVVSGNQVTLFSETCCYHGSFYEATIDANIAALTNPASYAPSAIPGFVSTVNSLFTNMTVGSSSQGALQLVEVTGNKGQFSVFSASAANGPWSEVASGALPGCQTSTVPCYSVYPHPELSTSSQLLVSYFLPNSGPGVPGNAGPGVSHLVLASIPLTTVQGPSIVSTSLAIGSVGHEYSTTLQATGGVGPYTWSITSGSLPVGLTLNPATGVISGTPSAVGTSGFTVQATDAATPTAETDTAALWIMTSVSTTAPASPTRVRVVSGSAKAGKGSLVVSYAAGSNLDSTTRYTSTCVSSNGGTTESAVHVGATAAPITVSGVTTKRSYRCTVTATNVWATSPPSSASPPVTVGAPAAPTHVHAAKPAARRLKVTFAAGADNGATIAKYSATCQSSNGGVTKSNIGKASPITIIGLTAGKRYTCTVAATNGRGTGPRSAPSAAVMS